MYPLHCMPFGLITDAACGDRTTYLSRGLISLPFVGIIAVLLSWLEAAVWVGFGSVVLFVFFEKLPRG